MKLRVAIIDDEAKDLALLDDYLQDQKTPFIIQTETFNQATNLPTDFDLYFMDIELPGIDGISSAKKIKEINQNAIIVFVSKREHLVFEAQKVDSLYFIRKDKLKSDLEDCWRKIIPFLIHLKQTYHFENKKEIVDIPFRNIIYYEVYGNELQIHTFDQKIYVERKTLKCIYQEMNDHDFCKIHHSIVVNFLWVKEIDKEQVIMKNGITLPLSIRHRKEVNRNWLIYQSTSN